MVWMILDLQCRHVREFYSNCDEKRYAADNVNYLIQWAMGLESLTHSRPDPISIPISVFLSNHIRSVNSIEQDTFRGN